MSKNLINAVIIWIIGLVVCAVIWLLATGGNAAVALVVFFVSLIILALLVWSGIRNFYDTYK